MKRILPAALLLAASCGRSDGSPDLQISGPWARETTAGQSVTAAYLAIANKGSAADRLVAVEAPAPAVAMVHATTSAGGVSRMRPIASGLELAAGATVQLAPGGTHVMITGLTSPLKAGDGLKLTLRFERSAPRVLDVPVRSAL